MFGFAVSLSIFPWSQCVCARVFDQSATDKNAKEIMPGCLEDSISFTICADCVVLTKRVFYYWVARRRLICSQASSDFDSFRVKRSWPNSIWRLFSFAAKYQLRTVELLLLLRMLITNYVIFFSSTVQTVKLFQLTHDRLNKLCQFRIRQKAKVKKVSL